ncbi:hypothetical protein [Haliscomenobacter sp.]|uniref:helix-turn-helix transcriptional regulator n=1 Tax=Haliscomenobacter sp. TaxID=2717303 RepID=UPI003364DE41
MANTWLFQRIPTEFKADFQYALAIYNVRVLLVAAIWTTINHLGFLWVDWQRYQEGLFEQVPAYRWLFYSNTSWWPILIIPINLAYNWLRIKNRNYPLQQLVWKIDLTVFFHAISVAIRIVLLGKHPLAEVYHTYLLLLFMVYLFRMDIRRRILLISIPMCIILLNYLINFQDSKLTTVFIYYFSSAFFVLTISSIFYDTVIKQLLVEKELEQQMVQLKEQADVIEAQKSRISDELEMSRRQLTSTALIMAEKQHSVDLLKTEVSSLDETAPISGLAKKKLLKIIDQAANVEDEWVFFRQQFELLEPSFFKNILHDFPALTQTDLKILSLIRMNVDSKEIATILRISMQSTHSARYRLRKRLGLLEEESLENFVLTYLS